MTTSPLRRVLVLIAVFVIGSSSWWAPRPAAAAAADWATFSDIAGASRAYSFTMQQPGQGFPRADVESTSYAATRPSGASTFLSPQTPVAAKYTSSRNAGYVNLAARSRGAGQPSVTTYTFARPTPASGWTFVLGDVDADEVEISATDTDGAAVDAADLGFRSSFNYCAPGVSPKPSCGSSDGSDHPTWDAATATLTGNETASDTAGASAWFEPSVALTSLTFVYSQRSGFPVYQTWFSALRHDVTGTVTAPQGQQNGITLRLVDPSGAVVGTTTTDDDGNYDFSDYATYAGYTVELVRPAGFTPEGPASKPADLSDGDAVVDFALRAIVGAPVSGTVVDQDGVELGGVTITLTPNGGGSPITTVTESDGSYEFDNLPAGSYTWSITSPDGYTVATQPEPLVVPPDSDTPIDNQDFVLRAATSGSLAGVVKTSDGAPLGGAQLRITGPDDEERIVYTDPVDGSYSLVDLPVGDYTIELELPPGYVSDGATRLTATIPAAGGDVTDQDFTVRLLPTGTISGTVAIDDAPPDVAIQVEVTGDGVDQLVAVDPTTGYYSVTQLPPGTYTATVVTPAGTKPVGPTVREVTIDADGTSVSNVTFTFVSIVTPPPTTPSPTPSPTPSQTTSSTPSPSASETGTPTSTPSSTGPVAPSSTATTAPTRAAAPVGGLSDTGGPALGLLVGGLLVVAIGVTLVVVRPRGRRG